MSESAAILKFPRQEKRETVTMLPTNDPKRLVRVALDIIEQCRASQGSRAAQARQLNSVMETGRQDGSKSIFNLLYTHVDRLAAHLFSPTDLRFVIDFENEYPKHVLERGQMAARTLTRDWERTNTDMQFAQGVFEALKYGSTFLKQWVQQDGEDRIPKYNKSLVMPWQVGVFREDNADLNEQPAFVETVSLTLPEVWRRIYHMPDAKALFDRIKASAKKGQADDNNSFFHQILSTSTLNTGVGGSGAVRPGGIAQLNADPNYSVVGPSIAADMVKMHELWLWGANDYVTVQIIEPDILLAPRYKHSNLLISGDLETGLHPYTKIQPNEHHGWMWGRSELTDLIEPQLMLSTWASDTQRLYGLQIDKILAFSGFDGVSDEVYDQQRAAGYLSMPPGAQANDITPKFPEQALPMLDMIIRMFEMIGGFDNILSGRGESGVRAGVHANTMLKTASPRLRDRSLLVERQCAEAADLRLSLKQAKDARVYWTDPKNPEKTAFTLADLPDDRRVSVDSHSGSPIFSDDHAQMVMAGLKMGIVNGEYAIETLAFPNKDLAMRQFKEKEEKDAAMMQELLKRDPEALEKIMAKKGGRR